MDDAKGWFDRNKFWLIALVLFWVAGVGIGWSVKPSVVRVEEKEVLVEKKVIDEKAIETEVAKRVKEIESHMEVKVVTKWIVKPDGTKETTETKETKTEVKEKEVEVVEKIVKVETKVFVDREVVKEKLVEPVLAQWMVGVGVGVAPRFDNPATTPVMLQVDARRRIFGPFFLGLQVQAGTPVTGFNVTNTTLFVTGAMEF